MLKVIYIEHSGCEHLVEAAIGKSLMQTAVDHLVPGILGDCGGNGSCATCHGYVDESWRDKLAAPSDDETTMLEGAIEVRDNSRLTCQIAMSAELDGIVVRLPERQF